MTENGVVRIVGNPEYPKSPASTLESAVNFPPHPIAATPNFTYIDQVVKKTRSNTRKSIRGEFHA